MASHVLATGSSPAHTHLFHRGCSILDCRRREYLNSSCSTGWHIYVSGCPLRLSSKVRSVPEFYLVFYHTPTALLGVEETVLEQKSIWGNQRALHKGGDIWSLPHRMDRISLGRGSE